jgi:hypothetical protein
MSPATQGSRGCEPCPSLDVQRRRQQRRDLLGGAASEAYLGHAAVGVGCLVELLGYCSTGRGALGPCWLEGAEDPWMFEALNWHALCCGDPGVGWMELSLS